MIFFDFGQILGLFSEKDHIFDSYSKFSREVDAGFYRDDGIWFESFCVFTGDGWGFVNVEANSMAACVSVIFFVAGFVYDFAGKIVGCASGHSRFDVFDCVGLGFEDEIVYLFLLFGWFGWEDGSAHV